MRSSACALRSSALVSPARSEPNSTATGALAAALTSRRAAARTSSTRKYWSRPRLVVANTSPQPRSAAARSDSTRAFASTSAAPDARAVASGSGNCFGRTSTSSSSDMFLSARAAAPMLPGCEVSTSTMRTEPDTTCYPNGPMHPLLNIAVRAARRAGEVIVRSLVRLESLEVTSKGRNDYVSEIDRSAEREIIEIIHKHYPEHAILAEESGRSGENDTVWIIDPLDGTTNFLHGFPVFAASIAAQQRGRLEIGVIYDPMRQEVFTAARGAGAHLENRRMRVSKQRTLDGALLATGFPYREEERHADNYFAMFRRLTELTAGIRRPGSAALDLAYVAAGRVGGFWEMGLKPWDTAAGTRLIREAGGRVGTLGGEEYQLGANIVAGGPKVYEALIEAIAPHVPEELRSV